MTSVASSGTSPMPGYEQLQGDFLADDESWAFVSQQGTSNPGSVGFFPSPDVGSLRSYGVVGRPGQSSHSQSGQSQSGQSHHGSQMQPSPPAPSPLLLDTEQQQFSLPAYTDQSTSFADPMSFGVPPSTTSFADQLSFSDQLVSPFSATSATSVASIASLNSDNGIHFPSTMATAGSMFEGRLFRTGEFGLDDHDNQDFTPYMATFSSIAPQPAPRTSRESGASMSLSPSPLNIPTALQDDADVPPWHPAMLKQNNTDIFTFEDFVPQPTPVTPSSSSPAPSASPHSASVGSPVSPQIKVEQSGSSSGQKSAQAAIRKVRDARVGMKKSPADSGSSSGSLSSSLGSNGSKFVIMTPTSISAHAGKPNLFECFDAMRMTQRGRKGPLANETKENALQVRRVGACFCCHARKVKCDAERPCKNCKKLTTQVPQIVCWQFQDFLTILFPDLLRTHFRKEEMAKFINDSVESFQIDGAERRCVAELSSGPQLQAVLRIPAKGFTAKVPDVLSHWRQSLKPNGEVDLVHGVAAAIGLEIESNAQREELRKLARQYIQDIVRDRNYAVEMTASMSAGMGVGHNRRIIPREVLRIVQTYALQSQSEIVKKALNIYTTHYIISRHLTFTAQSLEDLVRMQMVSPIHAFQTPRLLTRQFKAILDEINMREVQLIFEAFSKSLKPKMRREWAPCLAAFLVLTMFMEEVEVTADTFATAQNQINHNTGRRFQYNRIDILSLNMEVENMPFKQFAYQFHQVYQTHPTDASAKSFNPLVDDSLLNESDLGDPAAVEMVNSLRPLLQYNELVNLTMEPILGHMESHPFPRDVAQDYYGKLLSKFLLSFTSLSYLLDP